MNNTEKLWAMRKAQSERAGSAAEQGSGLSVATTSLVAIRLLSRGINVRWLGHRGPRVVSGSLSQGAKPDPFER